MSMLSIWRKLHLTLGASAVVSRSLAFADWLDRGSRTVDLNGRPLLKVDRDSLLSPRL